MGRKTLPNCSHTKIYLDYKELLKNHPEIQWILIGSKNSQHRDHCVTSFEAGKNVFCEKPLAITIEQCLDIRNAHLKSGKLFATGFVLRYAPMYIKIKEIIMSGSMGKIISVEANELLGAGHGGYIMRNWRRFRSESGSHILEKCCHDIDILNWLSSLPSRVASFGGLNIFIPENAPTEEKLLDQYTFWDMSWENINPFTSEKDIEDNQVVILEYRNKVRVSFHVNSNVSLLQRQLLIACLKGTIKGDLVKNELTYKLIGNTITELKFTGGFHGGGDELIIEDLLESMSTGSKPKATGEEGFQSAIVCFAIDVAMREGRVVDLEPYWKQFGI